MVRLSLDALNIGFEQSLLPTISEISEDTFISLTSPVFLSNYQICSLHYHVYVAKV